MASAAAGGLDRAGVHHPFTSPSPLRHPRRRAGPSCFRPGVSKVLIIEDDDVIAQGIARHLTAAGFDPHWVSKGEQGLARLRYERPDVCVLDLMLPGLDGWKLIETARAEGIGTPIVVVSARGTEHDRVHALEIGADDYLVKPFSMKELVARVGGIVSIGDLMRGVLGDSPPRGAWPSTAGGLPPFPTTFTTRFPMAASA